jgi:hypothetical protein
LSGAAPGERGTTRSRIRSVALTMRAAWPKPLTRLMVVKKARNHSTLPSGVNGAATSTPTAASTAITTICLYAYSAGSADSSDGAAAACFLPNSPIAAARRGAGGGGGCAPGAAPTQVNTAARRPRGIGADATVRDPKRPGFPENGRGSSPRGVATGLPTPTSPESGPSCVPTFSRPCAWEY